jgi:hypothetical protein
MTVFEIQALMLLASAVVVLAEISIPIGIGIFLISKLVKFLERPSSASTRLTR